MGSLEHYNLVSSVGGQILFYFFNIYPVFQVGLHKIYLFIQKIYDHFA